MLYARISGGFVAELYSPPAGRQITDCFAPSLPWPDVTAISPAPQPGWTATQAAGVWSFAAPVAPVADTRVSARAALDNSDTTIIRCYEHAVAVPAAWVTYRAALRVIVSGGPTTAALPAAPSVPAGT